MGRSVFPEQNVLMDAFCRNLKNRTEELGISNAEAARRSGLSERRYAHFVSGDREPDLATLVRIADALGVTPINSLASKKSPQIPRATSFCNVSSPPRRASLTAFLRLSRCRWHWLGSACEGLFWPFTTAPPLRSPRTVLRLGYSAQALRRTYARFAA